MRASKCTALVLAATFPVAFGAGVSAHRLDECLQAARIAIAADGVQLEMSVTPGTAVADVLIGDIDSDQDGVLSPAEAHAYAARVIAALTLRLDDSLPLVLRPARAQAPDLDALRAGSGAIVIRAEADLPHLATGAHRLEFRNGHAAASSVYLANALVPEDDAIAVTGQDRTPDQRELTIAFTVRDIPPSSHTWTWVSLAGACIAAASITRRTRSKA